MSRPEYIPKGFFVFYTREHSVCLNINRIESISKGLSGSPVEVRTINGDLFQIQYSFEDFLRLIADALEEK